MDCMRKAIAGEGLGEPIGAYSHGVWAGPTLYLSGVTGITEELLAKPDIAQETKNAMGDAQTALASQGLSFAHVVQARIYITDMKKFAEMNEAYKSFFEQPYPARATVEVAKLAEGANIEIVFTAYDPEKA